MTSPSNTAATEPQPATSEPGQSAPSQAPERDPLRQTWLWRTLRMPARILATLMFNLKAYDRHFVPQRGGVLLVANHQSYLDPVLIAVYLRRPMSYMAKSELFKNRYFGWLIRSLNAFPVKQGSGDVGAVRETIKRLREGHMLNIFPEGSRTQTGEIAPMLPGAALVVKKADVPIVPVVIDGSFRLWPKGRKFPRCGHVSVMYGPPINVEGLSAKQITELIDRTLRTMFDQLRAIEARRRREYW
jgi:1-acyl-sn-glycerol-3-phosphate acyltransferase